MKQYHRVPTGQFRKNLRRLERSGFDLKKLETVIDMLSTDKKLEENCHDHELKGRLRGTRECHIAPDWLLRYAKDDNLLILILIQTGDHRHVLRIE